MRALWATLTALAATAMIATLFMATFIALNHASSTNSIQSEHKRYIHGIALGMSSVEAHSAALAAGCTSAKKGGPLEMHCANAMLRLALTPADRVYAVIVEQNSALPYMRFVGDRTQDFAPISLDQLCDETVLHFVNALMAEPADLSAAYSVRICAVTSNGNILAFNRPTAAGSGLMLVYSSRAIYEADTVLKSGSAS